MWELFCSLATGVSAAFVFGLMMKQTGKKGQDQTDQLIELRAMQVEQLRRGAFALEDLVSRAEVSTEELRKA